MVKVDQDQKMILKYEIYRLEEVAEVARNNYDSKKTILGIYQIIAKKHTQLGNQEKAKEWSNKKVDYDREKLTGRIRYLLCDRNSIEELQKIREAFELLQENDMGFLDDEHNKMYTWRGMKMIASKALEEKVHRYLNDKMKILHEPAYQR